MLFRLCLALLAAAACAQAPKPRIEIASRPVPDTIDNPQLREALAQTRAAAARTDTIVVELREVTLRVGEAIAVDKISVTALDAAGDRIEDFAPVFVLASPVAFFNGLALTGRSAGSAELFVEALPSAPPHVRPRPRPSTRIQVTVRP